MNGHPEYKKILDEMWDLHCRKARSYGSNEDSLANLRSGERFGVPAWKRCLVESESAFYRTVNYCNGRNPSAENLENALMDAAAFSMLAMLFIREERNKQQRKAYDKEWTFKDREDWAVKAEALLASTEQYAPTGYRPPSEEIENRMTEVLEKAK